MHHPSALHLMLITSSVSQCFPAVFLQPRGKGGLSSYAGPAQDQQANNYRAVLAGDRSE